MLFVSANVLSALRHLRWQTGTLGGPGPRYLPFRGPLQLYFTAWAWYCGLRLGA